MIAIFVSGISAYLEQALRNQDFQAIPLTEWFSDNSHEVSERVLTDLVFTIKCKLHAFATNPLETFCLLLLEMLRSESTSNHIIAFLPAILNQLMQKYSIISVNRYFEHLCGVTWKEKYV